MSLNENFEIKPSIKDWADHGACKGEDSSDWFPPHRVSSGRWEGTRNALSICRSCPVVTECREYAIVHEPYGTWGGMTAEERDVWRQRNGIPAPYGARRLRVKY